MEVSVPEVDFVCCLPLEIVEQLLTYLDVEDLLRCRLVSRRWDKILVGPGLERLWISTCLHKLNLSSEKLLEYHEQLSFHVLAAVVLKHRKWLQTLISHVDSIGTSRTSGDTNLKANVKSFLGQQRIGLRRYPQCNLSSPTCFLGHSYVFTEYFSPSHGSRLSLSRVNTVDKTLASSPCNPISHAPYLLGRSWVYWATATPTYVLMLIQPDGQWIGYCPLSDKVVLDVKLVSSRGLITSGCVGVACCEKCFEVLTATASSEEASIWNLTVLKAGKPMKEGTSLDVFDSRTILVHLERSERVVCWKLVTHSPSHDVDDSGYCSSHNLICVTSVKVEVYQLSVVPQSENTLCRTPVLDTRPIIVLGKKTTLTMPKSPKTETVQVQSVCLSSDSQLLGVIVNNFHLCVWNVVKNFKLVSSAVLSNVHHLLREAATHARLIAVGHLYSVVVTFDSKPGGQISVVSTQSEKMLCQRRSRVQWFVASDQDYLRLVNEDWLNDVMCFNAPFFVYVNQSALRHHSAPNLSFVQFIKLTDFKK